MYLVFNEGYAVSCGETLVRGDLCAEAIRLGRILCELLPQSAEPRGLLALMLLHDARQPARVDSGGDLILLEDQDRSLWNREQICEGLMLVESALRSAPVGRTRFRRRLLALMPEPTVLRRLTGRILRRSMRI